MSNLVTTATMSAPIQKQYSSKLLSVEQPHLIFGMFAVAKALKPKDGETLRMERYDKLKKAMVPLGNSGVTPPSSALSSVYVEAKISFYGDWIEVNEQVALTSQSPVINQATNLLGISMRETEDALIRNVLAATANSIDAVGGVNGKAPTELSLTDVQESVRLLMSANAKKLTSMIGGSNKFGTAPVRASYFGLSHVDITPELSNIAGFTHTVNYPAQNNLSPAEYGAVAGIRFLVSSDGSMQENAASDGTHVYDTFMVGMESYAKIKLDSYSSRFVHRPAMYSGPLALNQTVGWKMAQAGVILNDNWILKVRSTRA